MEESKYSLNKKQNSKRAASRKYLFLQSYVHGVYCINIFRNIFCPLIRCNLCIDICEGLLKFNVPAYLKYW